MTVADFRVPRRQIMIEWLDRWAPVLVAVLVALVLLTAYWWLSAHRPAR